MTQARRVVVVFRSRLNEGIEAEYEPEAARMEELASSMPGFAGIKTFTADDGERVSIVEFESLETEQAWRDHPEHRRAQQRGRSEFYAAYRIQVCVLLRERAFEGDGAQG
jgi:heme-degrading monooxygenase HmoA